MMKRLLQAVAFTVPMFAATVAFAATAMVTTPLHMRTGPGTGYPVITTMPDGAVVDVRGCVRGYDWCRVDWAGFDGWASANYLAFRSGHYVHRPFAIYGATVGIPVISSVIIAPSHHHYRRHLRRERRHERRVERHHRRHERRVEHHERRHERRIERKERRHEHKAEHRHERHERKVEQRHKRHERKIQRRNPNLCPGGHRPHHGNC